MKQYNIGTSQVSTKRPTSSDRNKSRKKSNSSKKNKCEELLNGQGRKNSDREIKKSKADNMIDIKLKLDEESCMMIEKSMLSINTSNNPNESNLVSVSDVISHSKKNSKQIDSKNLNEKKSVQLDNKKDCLLNDVNFAKARDSKRDNSKNKSTNSNPFSNRLIQQSIKLPSTGGPAPYNSKKENISKNIQNSEYYSNGTEKHKRKQSASHTSARISLENEQKEKLKKPSSKNLKPKPRTCMLGRPIY